MTLKVILAQLVKFSKLNFFFFKQEGIKNNNN